MRGSASGSGWRWSCLRAASASAAVRAHSWRAHSKCPNPCHSIAPAMGTGMNRAVAFPLDASWLRVSVCENNEAPPLLTGALLRLSILTR